MQSESEQAQEAIDELHRQAEIGMPGGFLDFFLFLTMLASAGIQLYGLTLFAEGDSVRPVAWAVVGAGTSNLLLAAAIFGARESARTALESVIALGRIITRAEQARSQKI